MTQETRLWALIEAWRAELRFHVSQAELARHIGVSRSALSQWKLGKATPSPEYLRALQSATGIRYRDLLDAILIDQGYLTRDGAIPATSVPAAETVTGVRVPPVPPRRGAARRSARPGGE